MASMTAVLE
jgi:galactitol-specific phosphotransferase system IIB component